MSSFRRQKLTSIFERASTLLGKRAVKALREVDPRKLDATPKPISLKGLLERLPRYALLRAQEEHVTLELPAKGADWPGVLVRIYHARQGIDFQNAGQESEAAHEIDRLIQASQKGLPVVRPYVLLGAEEGSEIYLYLVTETFPRSLTIVDFISKVSGAGKLHQQARARSAKALAILFADLHNASLLHRKIDPTDIHIKDSSSGTPEMRLFSLRNAEFVEKLTISKVVSCLAQLCVVLDTSTSRIQRRRFLKAYCLRRGIESQLSELAPQVERRIGEMQRERNRRRNKNALLPSRRIGAVTANDWYLLYSRQLIDEESRKALKAIDVNSQDPVGAVKEICEHHTVEGSMHSRVVNTESLHESNEQMLRHVWGYHLALYRDHFPITQPLCSVLHAHEITLLSLSRGVLIPLQVVLASGQFGMHVKASVLNRLGRLFHALLHRGFAFSVSERSSLMDELFVELRHDYPDPRPTMQSSTELSWCGELNEVEMRGLVGQWIASVSDSLSTTMRARIARGYQSAEQPDKTKAEYKRDMLSLLNSQG